MLIFFSISAVMASPMRSMASRASARPLGNSAMPVVRTAAEERIVFSHQTVDPLEVALLQEAFALLDQLGRRGRFDPHLPEEPSHRRNEVDRKQQDHHADQARTTDAPRRESLSPRALVFGQAAGFSASAAGFSAAGCFSSARPLRGAGPFSFCSRHGATW